MKAEERHKLKTNQLADYIERAEAWIKGNSRLLLTVAAVIVVAAGLWFFFHYRQEAQTTRAWDDLGKVQKKYQSDNGDFLAGDLSAASEAFARVAKDYPSVHPVAEMAIYQQARALAAQVRQGGGGAEQAKRAEDLYQGIIDSQPYNPLVTPLSYLGLADVAMKRLDFSKLGDQDFKKIEALLSKVDNDPKADPAIQLLARDRQKALGQPEKLIREQPGTEVTVPIPGDFGLPSGLLMPPTTAGDNR